MSTLIPTHALVALLALSVPPSGACLASASQALAWPVPAVGGPALRLDAPHTPPQAQATPVVPRAAAEAPPQALAFLFEPNGERAPEEFGHLLRLPRGWAALGSQALELWARPTRALAPEPESVDARPPTQGQPDWQKLRIELPGARAGLPAIPEGQLGTWSSYRGNDASQWTNGATCAERLRYADIWPGIDVLYHAGQAGLRYDFSVAPGTSPEVIRLCLHGVLEASIAPDGRLLMETTIGKLEESAPRLFQELPSGQSTVTGGFVIHSHRDQVLEIGFSVGDYDPNHSLLIDPYFTLFAHFGGNTFESADAAISDSQGAWFVTGRTRSADFPYFDFPPGQPNGDDIFILRINAGGIVTDSVALAAELNDVPYGLAYRQNRVALVAASASTDMPIQGKPYQAQNLGQRDAYVAVFGAQPFSFVWSSYLGGDQDDQGYAVSFASNGDVLVAGETTSANFPALGPIDNGLTGQDAFVTRFLADGSDLVWSGSYGNITIDVGRAVAGVGDGATLLAGEAVISGNQQAFVVRLAANGQPDAPVYFGGSGIENVRDLLLDGLGGYWLLGETSSNDMDLVQALSIGLEGPRDAFLLHRDNSGSLDFSSYLGGAGVEDAIGLAAGLQTISGAAVHVLLGTSSGDLPVDNGMSALSKPTSFSAEDAYILGVGPAPDFDPIYSSYLPCLDREFPRDLCSDDSDRLLVVGAVIGQGGHADLPAAAPVLPAQFSGASAAFLCWIDNAVSATPGDVRFGALEGGLVMGQNLRFHAYRIGGATGAASVPWLLYNPNIKAFVNGYGGTLEFAAGQQIAEGNLLLPVDSYPDQTQLFLVLQEPAGPVELDTNFNIKELTLLDPEGGDGGGGGGGGSGESSGDDSVCALISLAGPDQGQRGLERLRWIRDHVLSRWQGGRQFTAGYYQKSPHLLRWLAPRPLLRTPLASLTWALLWLIGYGEWVLLGAALLRWSKARQRLLKAAAPLLRGSRPELASLQT